MFKKEALIMEALFAILLLLGLVVALFGGTVLRLLGK